MVETRAGGAVAEGVSYQVVDRGGQGRRMPLDCRKAWVNANLDFDEVAPRFPSQTLPDEGLECHWNAILGGNSSLDGRQAKDIPDHSIEAITFLLKNSAILLGAIRIGSYPAGQVVC